ncbi:MAG: DUF2071 domain-containing protein [Actinomycetota bacterium]
MSLHTLRGTIIRRVLVNYRVDPEVAEAQLPAPFTPRLVDGHAIAGVCLIELKVRPRWMPKPFAVHSLNAAHRFAVLLPDGDEAVYVPRRDTTSRLGAVASDRLFPSSQHLAVGVVEDRGRRLHLDLSSVDASVRVSVTGSTAPALPADSVFGALDRASAFFENGALGYAATGEPDRFDAIELATETWAVTPFAVDRVESSYFDDPTRFPPGSITLDNALLMRDIEHTWRARSSLRC